MFLDLLLAHAGKRRAVERSPLLDELSRIKIEKIIQKLIKRRGHRFQSKELKKKNLRNQEGKGKKLNLSRT